MFTLFHISWLARREESVNWQGLRYMQRVKTHSCRVELATSGSNWQKTKKNKNCCRKGSKTTYSLQWNKMLTMLVTQYIHRTRTTSATDNSSKHQGPTDSANKMIFPQHFLCQTMLLPCVQYWLCLQITSNDRNVWAVHYFVNILADSSSGENYVLCVWNNLWEVS